MSTMQWPAWGTTVTLQVTDPGALRAAHRLVVAALGRAEAAADLRNPHAEVHRLDGAAGRPVRVGPLLAGLIETSLDCAGYTGGRLDPTVGAAVIRDEAARQAPWSGKDLSVLPRCGSFRPPAPRPAPSAGWRAVQLTGRRVSLPAGTLLDLTAIGKAAAARYCARLVRQRLDTGVLICLGGDLVTTGPAPAGGWPVHPTAYPALEPNPYPTLARIPEPTLEPALEPTPDGPGGGSPLRLPSGTCLATVHKPVFDPLTGAPAAPVWRSVTVAVDEGAGGVVRAKALALAAKVVGGQAPAWLEARGAAAVLVGVDGGSQVLQGPFRQPIAATG